MDFVSRLFGLSKKGDNEPVNEIPTSVLVYGIFDRNITTNEIHEKFSKFGPISSVNFLPHEQMCYIIFTNSKAAENAIESTPDPYPVTLQDYVFQDSNMLKSYFDNFNAYILMGITKHIDMFDRVRLSIAYPHQFRSYLIHYTAIELSELDLQDLQKLNKFEVFEFLKVCGSVIKSINSVLTMDSDRCVFLAKLIGFYCTECVSLMIMFDDSEMEFFRKAVPNMRSLVELKILDSSFTEKDLLCIPHPTLLRMLTLTNNDNITGLTLNKFTHLRQLNLRNCGIRPHLLQGALKKMPFLNSLDVFQCETRNTCFQILSRYSRKIEELYFSYMPALTYADFQRFRNLKSLTFNYNSFETGEPNFPHELLTNLAHSGSPHLYSLKILITNCLRSSCFSIIARISSLRQLVIPSQNQLTDPLLWRLTNLPHLEDLNISRCTGFTNLGLATFCERCTTLKFLNISNCYFINHIFINYLLHILKGKEQKSAPPLIIYAKGSGVLRSFATSSRVRRCKKLLNIRYYNNCLDWHTHNFLYDDYQNPRYILHDDGNCSVCDNAI